MHFHHGGDGDRNALENSQPLFIVVFILWHNTTEDLIGLSAPSCCLLSPPPHRGAEPPWKPLQQHLGFLCPHNGMLQPLGQGCLHRPCSCSLCWASGAEEVTDLEQEQLLGCHLESDRGAVTSLNPQFTARSGSWQDHSTSEKICLTSSLPLRSFSSLTLGHSGKLFSFAAFFFFPFGRGHNHSIYTISLHFPFPYSLLFANSVFSNYFTTIYRHHCGICGVMKQ